MILNFRIFWLSLSWLWLFTIIVLSLISIPKTVTISIPHIDKLEHAISYCILMFLFAQCYSLKKTRIQYAVAFTCVGVLLEIFQSFTIDRFFEYADMVANTTGVILGLILSDSFLQKIVVYIDDKLRNYFMP